MGRWGYSRRRVLEHTAGIAIQDLKHYKLLNRDGAVIGDWKYTLTLKTTCSNDHLADVHFTVQIVNRELFSEKNYIQFDYEYQGQPVSFRHPIEIQRVHLGGYRYYFRCNAVKDGRHCNRRVKALYFGWHVWACRHCLELVYQNCRYSRDIIRYSYCADTFRKKAAILRQYNHPRKANRLQEKALYYEIEHERLFCETMQRRWGMLP